MSQSVIQYEIYKRLGLMQLNAQSFVARRFIAAPINRDSKQQDTIPNAR